MEYPVDSDEAFIHKHEKFIKGLVNIYQRGEKELKILNKKVLK